MVSTPLAGRLLRVTYDVGDSVVAGKTTLARMQPTDPALLDPRATVAARARVLAAERRLDSVKAELERSKAGLNLAELELGRLRDLARSAATSQAALDEAEYEFRAQSEVVRAATFNVEIAQYELELERSALLLTSSAGKFVDAEEASNSGNDALQDGLEFEGDPSLVESMQLEIVSPISGRVLRLYQESSAVLSAGAPLMELGDPRDLEIVVDALSQDAVRIEPGNQVLLRNWGGDGPLEGRVRRVEPSGFTKVSALGVEEQRVNVLIDLVDAETSGQRLGDGFRVDAEIVVWEGNDVLQIPTSALFRVQGAWHVFKVDGGIAIRQQVDVGQNNGIEAEVVGGLSENDRVIQHPGAAVADGTPVLVRDSHDID